MTYDSSTKTVAMTVASNNVRPQAAPRGKRCGTCIDRKVSCDRAFPACSTCLRGKRVCQGYSIRLSWPRAKDRKRLMIGPDPENRYATGPERRRLWVHATTKDVALAYWLGGRGPTHGLRPLPAPGVKSSTVGASVKEGLLFDYFRTTVSPSLITFSERSVGRLLLRLYMSEDSMACTALRRAILALASQMRHGLNQESEQLKNAAIHALIASTLQGITLANAVQHVAAGMVLCLCELHTPTTHSTPWLSYVSMAKQIIVNVTSGLFVRDTEYAPLADWVYYYDVMSSVCLRHYRLEGSDYADGPDLRCPEILESHRYSPPLDPRNTCLDLLAEVSQLVNSTKNTAHVDPAARCRLDSIHKKIERNIASLYPSVAVDQENQLLRSVGLLVDRGTRLERIYEFATLIYLLRASGLAPDHELLAKHIVTARKVLTSMDCCKSVFPLLIIGFEAKRDEDRLSMLELVERTENTAPIRPLPCVRAALSCVWNQYDLIEDGKLEIGYLDIITKLMSFSSFLPPLI